MILEEIDGSGAPGSILREFTAPYHEFTLIIRDDFRLSDPLFK